MEKHDKIEIRSEKIRDILDKEPAWIIRHGIAIVFFIMLAILSAFYLLVF